MFDSCMMDLALLLGQENQSTPWYESGWVVFAAVMAIIGLSYFVGHRLAKGFRMQEYGVRLSIILCAILFSSLIVSLNWPPKFGVDLRGGINIIGSLNLDNKDPDAADVKAQDIIPNLIRRIDPAGTNEIVIRALGDDKIEVIIPSVNAQEAAEIWNRLVRAGHLQFRILASRQYSTDEDPMDSARDQTMAGSSARLVKDKDEKNIARWVGIAREDVEGGKKAGELVPFKYAPGRQHLVRDSRTLQIIDMNQVNLSGNFDEHGRQFAEYCRANKIRNPQILVLEPENDRSNVEGKHLTSVRQDTDEYGRNCVGFNLTAEGGRRMGYFTQLNVDRSMGIVLDGQLHSAPNIQEPIYDRGRITGQFTSAEIRELIISLRSGRLDVALNKNPISQQFIESALGEELKQKGVMAIAVSLGLVLVFMILYYRFAGIVATIALLLNLLLILCLVMAIQQPLTLTGLAGLVLTVGMSVDANVLIFERIREEIDRGSALRMAIRNGFDKATTTIVDANVTTLITALVLYVIGTEQIKGFAVTLILGILMSMFTAIYCSRAVFDIAERRRFLKQFAVMRIMSSTKIDFLSKRFLAGFASVLLIAIGIGSMFILGQRILDHDLRGGSTARVVFNQAQDVEDIRSALSSREVEGYDEQVEFTVSALSGDPEYSKRLFKVDSNLPTWDGDGPSPYKDLSAVLSEVFEGKLSKLHVDFEFIDTTDSSTSQNLRRQTPLTVSANTSVRSALKLQEQGDDKQQESTEKKQADPPTQPTLTGPGNSQQKGETADGEQKVESQKQDNQAAKTANQDGDSQDQQESKTDSSNDFPVNDSANKAPFSVSKTDANLTFAHNITGKAIRTLLSEAANRLEITLDEEQIQVSSPEAGEDEDLNSFQSKEWKVSMELSGKEDAENILSSWSSQFNSRPYFPTASGVGGQIAKEAQLQALAAIIASLLGIIAYVWIRFQNVAFGLAAVIALIHDVLIVLGAIAISHFVAGALGFLGIENFKISLPIIAALLTIIGYSLNDTIVVFDRIREVRGKRAEITQDMINTSISQTLSRTILTSLTTFIVVFILYCFGGDAIHGFAFSLVIGVIVGTYSSIFVASPSLLWLMNTVGLNPGSVLEEAK